MGNQEILNRQYYYLLIEITYLLNHTLPILPVRCTNKTRILKLCIFLEKFSRGFLSSNILQTKPGPQWLSFGKLQIDCIGPSLFKMRSWSFFLFEVLPTFNGRTSYGSNPFPLDTPLPGLSTPYPSTPIALGTFVFLWPSDPDPACILPSGHVIRMYLSASLWDNQDLLRVGTKCILVSSLLKDTKNKLLFSREDAEECGS